MQWMAVSPRPYSGAWGGGGSKGQAWTSDCTLATPAFTRPSLRSQFLAYATAKNYSIGSEYFSLSSLAWARDKAFMVQGFSADSRCTTN